MVLFSFFSKSFYIRWKSFILFFFLSKFLILWKKKGKMQDTSLSTAMKEDDDKEERIRGLDQISGDMED